MIKKSYGGKRCRKKCFDKIGAMLAVAEAKHSPDTRRLEERYYWCEQCRAYHLTSQWR